jgi:hypothetical protein
MATTLFTRLIGKPNPAEAITALRAAIMDIAPEPKPNLLQKATAILYREKPVTELVTVTPDNVRRILTEIKIDLTEMNDSQKTTLLTILRGIQRSLPTSQTNGRFDSESCLVLAVQTDQLQLFIQHTNSAAEIFNSTLKPQYAQALEIQKDFAVVNQTTSPLNMTIHYIVDSQKNNRAKDQLPPYFVLKVAQDNTKLIDLNMSVSTNTGFPALKAISDALTNLHKSPNWGMIVTARATLAATRAATR